MIKNEDGTYLLTEEEYTTLNSQAEDVTAERDSLKTENDDLIKKSDQMKEEIKKLKESNFAFARKISRSDKKDIETQLHEMFKR